MKKIRKVFSLFIAASLILMLPDGYGVVQAAKKGKKANAKISSVKITNTGKKLRLQKGKKFKLKTSVKAKPNIGKYKKLKFTSSNRRIVLVNSRGLLKGLRVGTVRITAASRINPNKKASIPVSVTKEVLVTSIRLNRTRIVADEFNEEDIRLSVRKILPSNAKNKEVEWFTSDDDVADVDEDGVVTTGNVGTATVTARAADQGGAYATCRVTVTENRDQGEDDADVTEQPAGAGQEGENASLPTAPSEATSAPDQDTPPDTATDIPGQGTMPPDAATATPGRTLPPARDTQRPTQIPKTPNPTQESAPTPTPTWTPEVQGWSMEKNYLNDKSQVGITSMPDGATQLLYTGSYQGVFFDMSGVDFTELKAIKVTANVPAQLSFTFYNADLDLSVEEWWAVYKIMDFYPFWGGSDSEGSDVETVVFDLSGMEKEELEKIVYLSIGSHEFEEGDYLIYDMEFVKKDSPDATAEPTRKTAGETQTPEGNKKVTLTNDNVFYKDFLEDENGNRYPNTSGIEHADGRITYHTSALYSGGGMSFYANDDRSPLDLSQYSEIAITLSSPQENTDIVVSLQSDQIGDWSAPKFLMDSVKYGCLYEMNREYCFVIDLARVKSNSDNEGMDVYGIYVKYNGYQKPSEDATDEEKNELKKTITIHSIELIAGGQGSPETEPVETPILTPTEEPVKKPEKFKDPDEAAALEELIAEQRALGATVSEDLDSEEYIWDKGRLVGIRWGENGLLEGKNLSGSISFSPFTELAELHCDHNRLSSLDVSNNPNLIELQCGNNQLSSLDVSGNPALKYLSCENNQLSILDVSKNPNLADLECDSSVTVTGYKE